jgi:hypothetical protein
MGKQEMYVEPRGKTPKCRLEDNIKVGMKMDHRLVVRM